ncbi:IclR family transcriptional regulator [Pseudonocardia sp. CA-142604]|uniref:IclR family transcriptional regulator n=1 Tax=Pseudonocardia sp. CA-142604 TaxID=3240024 RepID=UPI003D8AF64D
MARPVGSNSVEKTLAVLDALGDHERIADIVVATGLHKSTVHRILQDFARLGFVRVTERGTYEGGPRILRLAGRVLARTDAAERAAPELHALQERCGGTVHFAVLDGDEAVYVAKVEGNKPYRMASRIGMAVPLHCTAIGKAALAELPEDEVRALLRRAPPHARTPATIADPDRLVEHLRTVRARGWAVDEEENEAGVRCVGAAVADHTRRVIGAVSVSQLVADVAGRAPDELGPEVAATARAISRLLGAPG